MNHEDPQDPLNVYIAEYTAKVKAYIATAKTEKTPEVLVKEYAALIRASFAVARSPHAVATDICWFENNPDHNNLRNPTTFIGADPALTSKPTR